MTRWAMAALTTMVIGLGIRYALAYREVAHVLFPPEGDQ